MSLIRTVQIAGWETSEMGSKILDCARWDWWTRCKKLPQGNIFPINIISISVYQHSSAWAYEHMSISEYHHISISSWYQALVLLAKLRLEPAVFIFFTCYGVFFATSQQLYIEKACKVRAGCNTLLNEATWSIGATLYSLDYSNSMQLTQLKQLSTTHETYIT